MLDFVRLSTALGIAVTLFLVIQFRACRGSVSESGGNKEVFLHESGTGKRLRRMRLFPALPPICPPTLWGIIPPSVVPIGVSKVPPIGTNACAPQQVQNPYTDHVSGHDLNGRASGLSSLRLSFLMRARS
jgi:hypothetical protein